MRTLVIESATEACSAAVFDEGELVAGAYEVIGRGHAERLVPMIAELPGKGRADRIAVSLGPGSFTGVRIGLAAAKALGLAWQAEVIGYPTLALVAAMARQSHPGSVSICMAGGHGEWFVQDFDAAGLPQGNALSVTPDGAAKGCNHPVVAGSRASAKAQIEAAGIISLDILPDARRWASLPASLAVTDLAPLYGRPPDARLPA